MTASGPDDGRHNQLNRGFEVLHLGYLDEAMLAALPEELGTIYAYWLGKVKDGVLPSRASIDPTEMPRRLSLIALVEAHPQPDGDVRFRDRLVGTGMVKLIGRDTTGEWLDEQGLKNDDPIRAFRLCWQHKLPLLAKSELQYPGRNLQFFKRILLPLVDAEGRVSVILEAFESPDLR